MEQMVITYYESPLGEITIESDGNAITGLWFEGQREAEKIKADSEKNSANDSDEDLPVFEQARKWLDLYFAGENPDFLPELSTQGTLFQQEVWAILKAIPLGETTTYGDIARTIAAKRGMSRMSAQAVGQAVGSNPISLMIPCHRVLGSNGLLTGYAGGVDRKRALLEREKSGKTASPNNENTEEK